MIKIEPPVYPDILLKQIDCDRWLKPSPLEDPFLVSNVGFLWRATEEGVDWWTDYFVSLRMNTTCENLHYITPKTPEIKAKLQRIYYNYKLGIEPL